MANKKLEPGMAYDMSKMNKVFAFLSILLLLTVFWVFLDDYLRPWKSYQIKALQIKQEKIDEKIAEFKENLDDEKLAKLKEDLISNRAIVKKRKSEIAKVNKRLAVLSRDIKEVTILSGQLNSQVGALGFDYGLAHEAGTKEADRLHGMLAAKKKAFAEARDRMKAYQMEEKDLKAKLDGLKKEVIDTENKISDMTLTLDLLEKARAKTVIDPIFIARNSPMIDYLDPTIKIQQIVVDNVLDDRYFQKVPKVDRCITCHTFISEPGYEDQPNPYKTHPNMDLMVGAKSPHPSKSFGCTSCHGGEGHRVHDFNSVAHTPQNEEQRAEWVEKYNWHEPHKIPQPMYKLQHTESQCLKCHQGVEHIPGATALNEGRDLIEKYGCYGCHKIEGWQHKRKPGPSLEKVASKVSKDFFKNWVWDPKSFNKHAMMPSFFMQSNNSEERFVKRNIAEVNAMAEFIWEQSKPYSPFMRYTGGNAENGKELVGQVGCLSCHGVEGFEKESKKVGGFAGPYLTGTGSKVSPDWLVSWLKKPSHYQEDTIMPSFRLTDKEASDIAAYLLSLKNEKFERLKFEPINGELRDDILIDYFSAFDTIDNSKTRLSKMSEREKTLELGKRSVGKYGCYSCHRIEGFDGRAPIGPELTYEGSKPLTQFGFNHQHHKVEHSRDGWIKAHLLDPRRWDEGMDKPFKDLTRMPMFYLSEKEAELMTLAIIGQVDEKIPLKGQKRLDSNEKIAAEGMKIVDRYNCQGCHVIDGAGGDLMAMFDDVTVAPPKLIGQGEKQKPDWFHYFLANVHPIRPYLNLRMPSFNFTEEERSKLTEMFIAKSGERSFLDHEKRISWEPGEREAARKMIVETYACTSCHTIGFNQDEAQAPNLYLAKRRLRSPWVRKWLTNPQAIYPGTLMPNFFYDEEGNNIADPDVLGGDPDKQMTAIIKYLEEIGYDDFVRADKNY